MWQRDITVRCVRVYLWGLLTSPAFIWFRGFMVGGASLHVSNQTERKSPDGREEARVRITLIKTTFPISPPSSTQDIS